MQRANKGRTKSEHKITIFPTYLSDIQLDVYSKGRTNIVRPILYTTLKSLYSFFLLYIYIYSNDEIEKEIRCCITKGEQTLFAQISCNNLIIMLIIGRTLIFLFAICSPSVRCLYKDFLVLSSIIWSF